MPLFNEGLGTHGNAWNNASTGAGGNSAVVDTRGCPYVSIFGTTSGSTTLSVQYSQDGVNFYTASTIAADGNFASDLCTAARYVLLQSSNNVTATATIAAKPV